MNDLEKRFVARLKTQREQAIKRAQGLQQVIDRIRQDQKRREGNAHKIMKSLAVTVNTLVELER